MQLRVFHRHEPPDQYSVNCQYVKGLLKRQRRCKQGEDSNRLADDRCNTLEMVPKIEIWELTDQTRQAVDPQTGVIR